MAQKKTNKMDTSIPETPPVYNNRKNSVKKRKYTVLETTDAIYKLARQQNTDQSIASLLKMDESTLQRNFAVLLKQGRQDGQSNLRSVMFEKAMSGNVTLMIWLSKQYLKFTDRPVYDEIDLRKIPKAELKRIVQRASEVILERDVLENQAVLLHAEQNVIAAN